MPHHTNPSDFILDICSLDLRNDKSEIESKARVETMVENWRKTHLPFDSLDRLEEGQEREDIKEVVDSKHSSLRRRHAPFSVAFPVLLRRSFLNTRRQPVLVISRVMQVVSLGIIQALFYARQDYAQVSVQNRIGMIQQTLATMFIGYAFEASIVLKSIGSLTHRLLNCVAVFPSERDILFHERADEAYSVEPFFLAYNLIEVFAYIFN